MVNERLEKIFKELTEKNKDTFMQVAQENVKKGEK